MLTPNRFDLETLLSLVAECDVKAAKKLAKLLRERRASDLGIDRGFFVGFEAREKREAAGFSTVGLSDLDTAKVMIAEFLATEIPDPATEAFLFFVDEKETLLVEAKLPTFARLSILRSVAANYVASRASGRITGEAPLDPKEESPVASVRVFSNYRVRITRLSFAE